MLWKNLRALENLIGAVVFLLIAGAGLTALADPEPVVKPEAKSSTEKVLLYEPGRQRIVIYAPESLRDLGDFKPAPNTWTLNDEKSLRWRLARSVDDLARVLSKMSGQTVPVRFGSPDTLDGKARHSSSVAGKSDSADKAVRSSTDEFPILVGKVAASRFGQVNAQALVGQGWRVVVTPDGIGLLGGSDLGTSYAVYELLDRLGCRWFIPSDLGEFLPTLPRAELPTSDDSSVPSTVFRGLSFTDEDFARRNRLGGLPLLAHHTLEKYITPKQLAENPHWRGTVDGQPSRFRLRWSADGLSDAIADAIIGRLEKNPSQMTMSLSPADGLGFDNSAEDRALDAADYDPSALTISITDRLLWFCNKIAARVSAKYPDVRLGMLAYINYARAPRREPVHPNIVPMIAPITYSRSHPITDDGEPNNKALRELIAGWSNVSASISYYLYGFYLAETAAPNPMIRKWSIDVPFVLSHGRTIYWQPESLPNFETSAQAHYLSIRLSFNKNLKPADIMEEFHRDFYGAASGPMRAYWDGVDAAWVDTPEYSGCGFGHLRRWTPERMKSLRLLMNAAKRAAKTDMEKKRVQMADDSLALFELFMKLRQDFAAGKWGRLAIDAEAYMLQSAFLAERYREQFAFCGQLRMGGPHYTLNMHYFRTHYQHSYNAAAQVARDYVQLTPTPIRKWHVKQDPKGVGVKEGWHAADADYSTWRTTDSTIETWSTIGLHSYFGKLWYRTSLDLPKPAPGRRVYLWIGSYDGSLSLHVNGKPCPGIKPDGQAAWSLVGYAVPAKFDITDAVVVGKNQIALLADRVELNELGTGGVLGPATVIMERPVPVMPDPALPAAP